MVPVGGSNGVGGVVLETAKILASGLVSDAPLRIYTGILGQIGDIVMFTPTVRRIKQLFPRSHITWAVSARYREAGELVAGLPYVDRLFVTELYFEKLTDALYAPWQLGWPIDLRGDDEVEEQRRHDLVFETRPVHRRPRWWEYGHLIEAGAYNIGVPGPIDLRTEIRVPPGTTLPPGAAGAIVFHNDPFLSQAKAWPWEQASAFIRRIGPERVVILGRPGPEMPGTRDLRGETTLAQAAAVIAAAQCYVGVESGLLCIAGALQVAVVGLFSTSHTPACRAIYPQNPRAVYLQAEGPLASIEPEVVYRQVQKVLARSRPGGGEREPASAQPRGNLPDEPGAAIT